MKKGETTMKNKKLKDLNPGDMFRRENGTYRYIVSSTKEECSGSISIWCHNLDGDSDGYWHGGSEKVILIAHPEVLHNNSCSECFKAPQPPDTVFSPIRETQKTILLSSQGTFYMCYVERGGTPTYIYKNSLFAWKEAQRLAKLTGKRTFVLQAITSVDPTPPMPDLESQRVAYYKARRLAQAVYKEATGSPLETMRSAKAAYDKAIGSAEEAWYKAEEDYDKAMKGIEEVR